MYEISVRIYRGIAKIVPLAFNNVAFHEKSNGVNKNAW